MNVLLRPLVDADLDQLFVWERDARAVAMAAFPRADPSDRAAFDDHYQRVRGNPDNTLLAIEDGRGFAGTISSFTTEGEREVSYRAPFSVGTAQGGQEGRLTMRLA